MNCILYLLISSVVLSNASKLNVPRVLLSYNYEQPSNFTLKVIDGGCYDWRSTRGTEVVVRPLYNDGSSTCATQAVVSAVTHSPARQTAIILASDTVSGVTLRCDVIIDSFFRLEIVTTTRELYVEEAPEEFEVRAYDDQGNEFSSLDGLKFEWLLENVAGHRSSVPAQTVLKFMQFADSPYQTPRSIAPLEEKGHQGSRVLIEGRQTGLGRLKASIPHSAYHDLPPSAVTLMVIANLLLEPQDVYVLAGTSVLYSVLHLKHGILHPVPLQPSHYYLMVEEVGIGELQSDGITVVSLKQGQTKVVLHDRNVKSSSSSIKQPTANYHVVEPGYLTIEIDPGNKPTLIVGRNNAFHVHVYDKHNNKIYLTDNIAIETALAPEYFNIQETRPNGTFVYGVPRKEGKMTVIATLSHITVGRQLLTISPPLTASVDVIIYSPVKVSPKMTVLPWDPVSRFQYGVPLSATGGSGALQWRSNSTAVASVDGSGNVTTVSVGHVRVTAAMVQNTDNNDSAYIWLVEVLSLSLVEGEQEGVVGAVVEVSLSAHTHLNTPFTQCHTLPYTIAKLSANFAVLPEWRPSSALGACAAVDVVGQQPGFSRVQVSYTLESGKELTVSTTIGAYRPLEVSSPVSGLTVLAPDTGTIITFRGGPLPWINKPAAHYVTLSVPHEDVIHARIIADGQSSSGDEYAVWVECKRVGEAVMTLTVGNRVSNTLPRPKQATATSRVVCGQPEAMRLEVLRVGEEGCGQEGGIARCHSAAPLLVTVTDSGGRALDNVSSLLFTWAAVDPQQLAVLPEDGRLNRGYGDSSTMDYGLLQPVGQAGHLTVTVGLPIARLTASLDLHLVNDASLKPSELVLLNHPRSGGSIAVVGGSGYFKLSAPAQTAIKTKHLAPSNEINVTAISDGNFTVSVVDLCLTPTIHPKALIRVTSMASVELSVSELVEEGGNVEATLMLLDSNGLPLPIQPSLMTYFMVAQEDLVEVKFDRLTEVGSAVYRVTGARIGDTSLQGGVTVPDVTNSRLFSTPQPIQVYPPLRLQPTSVTLLVGAVYQVLATGGPYPASRVEFYPVNSSVCSVDSVSGVVRGELLGNTTVKAKAVLQLRNRQLVMHSSDMVSVRVVAMASLELEAPTHTLEAGASMPLLVTGRGALGDKLTPLSYASAQPALYFDWSSSDKQVATIVHPLEQNDIVSGPANAGVVRLQTHNTGLVTVTVSVTTTRRTDDSNRQQIVGSAALTGSIQVQVFEGLSVLSPAGGDNRLLMAPNSEYKIKSNRDIESSMSYSIPSCGDASANATDGVVTVTSDGVVTAGDRTGDTTLLVTATESFGVTQLTTLLVEVREVRYFQSRVPRVLSGGGVTSVPVGAVLPVMLSYHDNVGRAFHAVTHNTHSRTNRRDLVRCEITDNSSVAAVVGAAGWTVLELQHRAVPRTLRHYLILPSHSAITPDKPCVCVGECVTLSTLTRGGGGEEGQWTSDGSPVAVDRVSGVAVGRSAGTAVLRYTTADMELRTEVTVTNVLRVELTPPSAAISDGVAGVVAVAAVSLVSSCAGPPLPLCRPRQLPNTAALRNMHCTLALLHCTDGDVSDVIISTPTYSPDIGYGCSVEVLTPLSPRLARLYQQHSSLVLSLTASIDTPAGTVTSEVVELPVLPGVSFNSSAALTITNEQPLDNRLWLQGPRAALEQLTVSSNSSEVEGRLMPIEGGRRFTGRGVEVAGLAAA